MPNRNSWHLGQLDSLRGIAVLNVLLVHSLYWGPQRMFHFDWPPLTALFFAGQRGVQLFFLLSAFTLFLSNDQRRDEAAPVRNFFIRRLFRIAPMFYVSTCLAWLIWRGVAGGLRHTLLSVLFVSGFFPAAINHGALGSWSVATEAAFYLCLPVLFRLIRSFRGALVAYAVALAVRLTIVKVLNDSLTDRTYWDLMSLPANMPTFALGIVLFFLWRDFARPIGSGSDRARQLSALCLLVCFGAYLEQPPADAAFLILGTTMHFFLILALLLHPWALFVNRFTVWMGKISFSFYLLHFYVAHAIELFLDRRFTGTRLFAHTTLLVMIVLLGTLAITVPLAYLSWRFVEEPFVRLGRRLIAHLEHHKVAPGLAEQQF